jgi:hypothetical protein
VDAASFGFGIHRRRSHNCDEIDEVFVSSRGCLALPVTLEGRHDLVGYMVDQCGYAR